MKVLNIITGSIAAYKNIDFLRELRARGHEVEVILTATAEKFVSRPILEVFCQGKVWQDDVLASESGGIIQHIRLAKEADIILIAPASANFLAKLANGQADTLALATLLATRKPVVVVPAMNPFMWSHPLTQHNVARLQSIDVHVLGPAAGEVACGDSGEGKYIDLQTFLAFIQTFSPALSTSSDGKLVGKRAIVTVGGTREAIDPVRFIGNSSSGKTGFAIAEMLQAQGCEVEVIAGYVSMPLPHLSVKRAYTCEAMQRAVEEALPADYFIGCAAICDFKPKHVSASKIKKTGEAVSLLLEPNPDILKGVATHPTKRPACVVGFALETGHMEDQARLKLYAKNLDGIVANRAEYLEDSQNHYVLLNKELSEDLGIVSKNQLAQTLVERIIQGMFQASKSKTRTG